MSRTASCALLFVLASASLANAQEIPAPPPAYASASIGLDLVLEPLASAAETDLAGGNLAMALARMQVLLENVPAASSVHVRAEGLALLARQRLGEQPTQEVPATDVYAALVTAAGDDVTASRFDLGRARLAWVIAHVPADSALALRARAIGAALESRARTAPAYGSSVPLVVSGSAPEWAPVPSRVPAIDPRHHPRHRMDLEMVDLYVTGGLMGAYFGAWIPASSGILDHATSDDANRIVALSMIAGAGVLTLGVFAIDQIDDGPHLGQPTSIAAGMRFGFVLSGLTLGVLAAEHDYNTATMFDALGIGLIGGTTLGAVIAYAAEPHPAQVQFTQATGVWGGILGAELAAMIAPLAFPNFGASHARMETGFGITLGGLSVGLVTGILTSVVHENFSARRSWLTTLGLVAGTAGGSLVWLLESILDHGSFDLPTWGALGGGFGLAGLILAAVLTDGDRGARDFDEAPPVQVSIAPTMGGASVGFSGAF